MGVAPCEVASKPAEARVPSSTAMRLRLKGCCVTGSLAPSSRAGMATRMGGNAAVYRETTEK